MQFPTIDRTYTLNANNLTGPQTSYYWSLQAFGYNSSNPESTESFQNWIQNGALYSARFDKSLADTSTQVQVDYAHSVAVSGSSNILGWIVSQSDKMVKFTYSNGVVSSVTVYDS